MGDPFLRVRIATTAPRKGLVGYRVDVDFAQIVFLRRNPLVTFNRAQTWAATPAIGLTRAAKLLENVNSALAQQISQFIAAYLSVKPGGSHNTTN